MVTTTWAGDRDVTATCPSLLCLCFLLPPRFCVLLACPSVSIITIVFGMLFLGLSLSCTVLLSGCSSCTYLDHSTPVLLALEFLSLHPCFLVPPNAPLTIILLPSSPMHLACPYVSPAPPNHRLLNNPACFFSLLGVYLIDVLSSYTFTQCQPCIFSALTLYYRLLYVPLHAQKKLSA